ncbi:MAG: biotin/lipoyl-binding protein [Clostridia bacterium]|nr:biotin/lipoyl-binding protein [Clostridia bacterium]
MKQFKITVNGKTYDVAVEETGSAPTPVTTAPVAAPVAAPAPAAAPAVETTPAPAAAPAATGAEKVNSPMPGNIIDIKVSAGDTVKNGDTLLILEAMKMENEIKAPCDGTVAGVHVAKGDTVDSGALLISLN